MFQPQEDITDSKQPLFMEMLSINKGSGQSYGYIVYRKNSITLQPNSVLKINGKINGAVMVVVGNELKSPHLNDVDDFHNFGYWCSELVK